MSKTTLLRPESSGFPMAQAMPQPATAQVVRSAADQQRRVDLQHSRSAHVSAVKRDSRAVVAATASAVRRQHVRQEPLAPTNTAANVIPCKPVVAKPTSVAQAGMAVATPSVPMRPVPRVASLTNQKTASAITAGKPETAVVQLRLSSTLVKVIAGLSKAGQKPCHLIEQILWEDRRICDAASILRLRRIIPRRKATSEVSPR